MCIKNKFFWYIPFTNIPILLLIFFYFYKTKGEDKIVWKTVLYILQRKKLISKISFSTLEIVWTRLTLHTKILTDKKAHSFMQRIFSMWFSYTRHCAVWYEWSRKYSMSKIKNIKENFKKKLFLESFRIHRMHSPQRKLGNN